MLAALAGPPRATCASRVDVIGGRVTVMHEVDDGFETVSLTLSVVITMDLRLNRPRYVMLSGIMEAKKKSLDTV